MAASDAPATTVALDSAEAAPEVTRDLLVSLSWALAAAVRSSLLITADVDTLGGINAALQQTTSAIGRCIRRQRARQSSRNVTARARNGPRLVANRWAGVRTT
jgi:hypothetical protein